jgi:hypothetical protein
MNVFLEKKCNIICAFILTFALAIVCMRIAHAQEVRVNTLSIGEYDQCRLVKVISTKNNDIYNCTSDFGHRESVSLVCFPSMGLSNNKYSICSSHEFSQ